MTNNGSAKPHSPSQTGVDLLLDSGFFVRETIMKTQLVFDVLVSNFGSVLVAKWGLSSGFSALLSRSFVAEVPAVNEERCLDSTMSRIQRPLNGFLRSLSETRDLASLGIGSLAKTSHFGYLSRPNRPAPSGAG